MSNVPRPCHHSIPDSIGDILHFRPPSPSRQDVLNASHVHEIETEDAEKTDLTHGTGQEQARNGVLISNRVDHRTREGGSARKRRDANERVDVKEDTAGWTEGQNTVTKMWFIHYWRLKTAGDGDEGKLVGSWKGTADSILIFTGLFSATVSAFILESYKSLLSNSSNSVVLIELSAVQRSPLSRSLGLETSPSTIPLVLNSRLPPESAVRLNVLWLVSLCISISCALGAVIVQQWARRFERICGQRHESGNPIHIESRLRLRLIASVTRHHVPTLINAIMSILHIAVFLFFAGLIEFFWSINHTVAVTILVLQSAFGALYLLFTVTPFIAEISVIQTPLTSAIGKTWGVLTAIWLFFKTLVGARSGSADSYSISESTQVSARSSKPVQVWERLTEAIRFPPSRFLHDYRNTEEYSFAKTALITGSEIKGLAATFEILRVENASNYLDSLADFCSFLIGICSILSLDSDVGARKIAYDFLTFPSTSCPALFGTWESWLVYILKKHVADRYRSVQFIALCMRMHWFMLIHYHSNEALSVFSRLEGLDFCDPKVYIALKSLHETHPKLSVAIAARCFQACLAADLPIPRFYSDEALCWKLVSAPESVHIHSFGLPQSPGDRSLIIIMGLIHDMGEIEKRTYTSREARKVILKQRSQVLSAVIESMVEKVRDDIPYQDISNKFVGFCHEHHRYCRDIGIEPALNKVLAELGERELPELSPSPQPPPSPAPADTDEDDRKPIFNPITAIQDVADKSIQMLQRKRRAWAKDEGGEAAAGASNKETDAEV